MEQLDLTAIGLRIKRQREALGFTQQVIYEKIDVSQNHYSRIENGRVGMSIEVLLQISEILNVSTDYILTGKFETASCPDFALKYSKLSEKQKRYINQQIEDLKEYDLK
ncbi:MAG: helix-turn-helix domain-containing protein [Oscillospiraceae bacterium]